jgi:hypothetical protein
MRFYIYYIGTRSYEKMLEHLATFLTLSKAGKRISMA